MTSSGLTINAIVPSNIVAIPIVIAVSDAAGSKSGWQWTNLSLHHADLDLVNHRLAASDQFEQDAQRLFTV